MRSKNYLIIAIAPLFGALISLSSCGPAPEAAKTPEAAPMVAEQNEPATKYDTSDPMSMLASVAQACGGMEQLKSLHDVEFDYHYLKPDGKKDISTERYIFEGEVSWARYTVHEENVAPTLVGDVVQFNSGTETHVHHDGAALTDPMHLGGGTFLRKANYMWFTMMFKMCDPGTSHEYMGQENVDGTTYDMVSVNYESGVTGKEQNDSFILYINPENQMVEQFKFSLPAMGVNQPILLAKLSYEEIDGIQVVTNRQMFGPSPDGNGMVPMVDQQLKNIRFNNGFTEEQLSKEV